MIAATSSAVSGSAWPRPPARRLAGEALQNAADAIMAGRIIGARVDVAGADRGADGADGGRGGALVDPLGKVGGDGQRIGWQGGVSVQRRPFRPPAPCAAVLRPRVRGAAITECRIGRAPGRLRSIRPAGLRCSVPRRRCC